MYGKQLFVRSVVKQGQTEMSRFLFFVVFNYFYSNFASDG